MNPLERKSGKSVDRADKAIGLRGSPLLRLVVGVNMDGGLDTHFIAKCLFKIVH